MKKLDKLIMRAFAGPFLLTFAVTEFVFLTQTMMKYMDDLVGKDLGAGVLAQLLVFFSVLIVPISLPLAVLLSSLMTYGNLGEHHELTAIKTSGISLTRILRPVMLFSVLLAGFAFWFNNTIVPKANLKAFSLLWDVRQQKLALDIREGVFYNGIPGYTIKVDKKLGENGDRLHGVMIYDHSGTSGNAAMVVADSGRMYTRFGGQYLGLELFHGRKYVEQPNARDRAGAGFVQQRFNKTNITFSLASFNLSDTPDELFSENKMMKTLPQLHTFVDSVHRQLAKDRQGMLPQLNPYFTYLHFDTTGQARSARVAHLKVPAKRMGALSAPVVQATTSRVRNLQAFASSYAERLRNQAREAANYRIEVYRKYTQTAAILVMFLIGAPLGSIIKKGGLGVPVLVSIFFFIVFYVVSIIGEKYGREFVMPVGFGMWMSNVVLLPAGLFFLYQARHDSSLFEVDFWQRLTRRLPKWMSRRAEPAAG
ncbi:YjgP/YjgQ family permease [Hymenobacter busanensis]|uniref:YjgP/YjgQ family permease n=1 Tax=Hymenobacter busanensis TaxID=2607656 RepID=A0A7L4ZSW0_9BACT|nr:LptF/LptG family permease [Hymenobacter busanensis]KAA9339818.1 YjgP/YjgQ family permease [Hymenobacter busanensis]QHJ06429.1 LptF/LptG family permease [Hymenobacter busanensis]